MYYNKVEICGVNTAKLPLLTDEEKNKISQLGILGTFSSVDDEELEKLKNIISPKQENNTKRKSLLLKIQDMYEK